MTAASGHIDVQRMAKRQPRAVHIHHFDIVTHHGGRLIVRKVVRWIQWDRAWVSSNPGSHLFGHGSFVVQQQRIGLQDVAPIRSRGRKRRIGKIVHFVREEDFEESSIALREQNRRASHAQSFGAAANPVRRIAGREQKFCRGWTTREHGLAFAPGCERGPERDRHRTGQPTNGDACHMCTERLLTLITPGIRVRGCH